jgi:hypothetical protein
MHVTQYMYVGSIRNNNMCCCVGDKARFDHALNAATQPHIIVQHLKACVPPTDYITYIASDEFAPDYFSPIRRFNYTLYQAKKFIDFDFGF